jgi:hypothetical protein
MSGAHVPHEHGNRNVAVLIAVIAASLVAGIGALVGNTVAGLALSAPTLLHL